MLLCFEGTGMRKGRWYPQTTYMTLQKKKTTYMILANGYKSYMTKLNATALVETLYTLH